MEPRTLRIDAGIRGGSGGTADGDVILIDPEYTPTPIEAGVAETVRMLFPPLSVRVSVNHGCPSDVDADAVNGMATPSVVVTSMFCATSGTSKALQMGVPCDCTGNGAPVRMKLRTRMLLK